MTRLMKVSTCVAALTHLTLPSARGIRSILGGGLAVLIPLLALASSLTAQSAPRPLQIKDQFAIKRALTARRMPRWTSASAVFTGISNMVR